MKMPAPATILKGGTWIIICCLFIVCSCAPSREQCYDLSLFVYTSAGYSEEDVLSGTILPILIEPEMEIRFVGTRPLGYLRQIRDDRVSLTGVSVGINENDEKSIQIINDGHLYDFRILLTESPLKADVEMRMLTDDGADQMLFHIVDHPLLLDEFIALHAPPWVNIHEDQISVFLRLSKAAAGGVRGLQIQELNDGR